VDRFPGAGSIAKRSICAPWQLSFAQSAKGGELTCTTAWCGGMGGRFRGCRGPLGARRPTAMNHHRYAMGSAATHGDEPHHRYAMERWSAVRE
jgi:hypothetical protein